jgi:hypothetical protein
MLEVLMKNVVVGALTAIVLGALTLAANWALPGSLVRALGGVTKQDVAEVVRSLAIQGPQGPKGNSGPPGPTGQKGEQGPPGKAAGFSLVAGGIVNAEGDKVVQFGPFDFAPKRVDRGIYTVRFIGAPPSAPPFILIGSTRNDVGVSAIVTKRARDEFQVNAVYLAHGMETGTGFWFLAIEPSPRSETN